MWLQGRADFATAALVTIISQLAVPVPAHSTPVQEGGRGGGGVTLGGDSAAGGAGVGAEAWDKKSQ